MNKPAAVLNLTSIPPLAVYAFPKLRFGWAQGPEGGKSILRVGGESTEIRRYDGNIPNLHTPDGVMAVFVGMQTDPLSAQATDLLYAQTTHLLFVKTGVAAPFVVNHGVHWREPGHKEWLSISKGNVFENSDPPKGNLVTKNCF